MVSSRLIRLSGLAGMLGGSLWVLVALAFTYFLAGKPESVTALTRIWTFINTLDLFLGSVLVFLALIGLYAHQSKALGVFGLIAFLIAFVGMTLFFGFRWGNTFIVPEIARAQPDFLDAVQEKLSGSLAMGYMLTFSIFSLGWFLFGLASLRGGVLPRRPVAVVMIGGGLMITAPLLQFPLAVILFGLGFAWLGYSLWVEADEQSS